MEADDSHVYFFYLEYNSEKCLMFHLEDQLLNLWKGIQECFPN